MVRPRFLAKRSSLCLGSRVELLKAGVVSRWRGMHLSKTDKLSVSSDTVMIMSLVKGISIHLLVGLKPSRP